MNKSFAEFFARLSAYPIVVTIQPNLRWTRNRAHNPSADVRDVWELLGRLLYRLDRLYSGCPRPENLPPEDRINGIAVMEKHGVNPHLHVLIKCHDPLEQALLGLFLFEMLDNATKSRRDPRDDEWQKEAWECLRTGRGWSRDLCWDRKSTILSELAPAGTAMVQIVRSEEDCAAVCGYITKTWQRTASSIASKKSISVDDEPFDFRELSEYFSVRGKLDPARNWRRSSTGGQILNLDDPYPWKLVSGRRIKS